MSDRLTSDDIQRFLSEASRINLFSASDLNLKDPLEHNRLQQILSLTSNIESNLVPEILNRKLARAVTYCITSCSSPRLKESVQERELLGDLGLYSWNWSQDWADIDWWQCGKYHFYHNRWWDQVFGIWNPRRYFPTESMADFHGGSSEEWCHTTRKWRAQRFSYGASSYFFLKVSLQTCPEGIYRHRFH